jgi:transposase
MQQPLFVRALTAEERASLAAGLRSAEAFVFRRSQILLASAEGRRVPRIAQALRCDEQTVRNAIHAFDAVGVAALRPGSRAPKTVQPAFDAERAEQLRELLHQSPRTFGQPTSLWTLALAADVSCAQGLIPQRVSGETIRMTLKRLGVGWKRAKRWLTSPDPAYLRKKGNATA